jgi:hypothetical protein
MLVITKANTASLAEISKPTSTAGTPYPEMPNSTTAGTFTKLEKSTPAGTMKSGNPDICSHNLARQR